MQEQELNDLLNAYNRQLEEARLLNLQSWVLNLQNYSWQQKQKANTALGRLGLQKKIMVALGIVYGLGLLFLAVNSMTWPKIFFCICTAAIGSITLYAVVVYIQQLHLIRKFSNDDDILSAQQKLVKLQDSTLSVTRILFLQTPFYCLFFVSPAMIAGHLPSFLFITLPIALAFAFASWWLYRNIDIKNAEKKWFRFLFGSSEWVNLVQSKKFLDEIDAFKKEIAFNR